MTSLLCCGGCDEARACAPGGCKRVATLAGGGRAWHMLASRTGMSRASPWTALEAGADADASARALRAAHERFFSDGRPGEVRPVVSASWRRCLRAGVAPGAGEPIVLGDAALRERRAASGLALVVPPLPDVLAGSGQLLIVTDAHGHLLWVDGDAPARARAERVA